LQDDYLRRLLAPSASWINQDFYTYIFNSTIFFSSFFLFS
jgi:hypothetical protein